ncbi:MAG TPA: hypothetical protein VFG50_10090 [Rhodothermales bacterium]|nr:hypothetical protein [Rhodothermales bacterium]
MLAPEPSLPDELHVPERLDTTFPGFRPEAFEILERLRAHPHVEQYRQEKPGIERYLMAPFRAYRDDLAVNLVLPNGLPWETERNVFSRLLKNDFGAGGCHHHLWMSFYRHGYTRLKDIQLPHSIDPDGFSIGLYLGSHAPAALRHAKRRIAADPHAFRSILEVLLRHPDWRFDYYLGTGAAEVSVKVSSVSDEILLSLQRASGLWLRTQFTRPDVIEMRGDLVRQAVQSVQTVWSLYRFFASNSYNA